MKSCEKGLWALILLLTAGLLYAVFFLVPPAEGLGNLVRIAFFHIPVAWVAVLAVLVSAWYALRYLRRPAGRGVAPRARRGPLRAFRVPARPV